MERGSVGGRGVWGTVVKLTCADADYHVAWSICRRPHRSMLSRGIYGCARVSSGCTAWWNAAGNTCKWTHTWGASCDGNPTGSHRCRFALQQTFWQTIYIFRSFLFTVADTVLSLLLLPTCDSRTRALSGWSRVFYDALSLFLSLSCALSGNYALLLSFCRLTRLVLLLSPSAMSALVP